MHPAAERIPADDHHRRSIYTFVKRNAPHPAMADLRFAGPRREHARRQTSNTPLQALVLLDDPQYLEAYRRWPSVLKSEADEGRADYAVFRLATRAAPRPGELAPHSRRITSDSCSCISADRVAAAAI